MAAGLSGCAGMDEKSVALVKGNLDEIYLGTADEAYLELTGSTLEECLANYEEGLIAEAELFCYYFSIEYPTEEIISEIASLYKEIYAKANYSVGQAQKLSNSSYLIPVEVSPIDIFEVALSNWDSGMADFYESNAGRDAANFSDEEYAQWDADWAQAIISHIRAQLPSLSYKDAVKTDVYVNKNENGVWIMDKASFYEVDSHIIYYPSP